MRRLEARASALAWGCALALCALAGAASAHIVGNTTTLRGLTAESDLVVRARITRVTGIERSAEAPGSRPGVEASVLEVVKGAYEGEHVRFAQHGHGVVDFAPGDETLVFLVDVARSRELDALGRAGTFAWVSLQEHDEKYDCEGAPGEALLEAARGYAAAEREGTPEERLARIRDATFTLLVSGDTRLAAGAVRDLAAAPHLELVTEAERPRLEAVLDDASVSMGVRVGLATELERRGLTDAGPRWRRWLSAKTPSRDRITAIRAAAGAGRMPAGLVALVADPDEPVAAAAAIAVGAPGNDDAVPALREALAAPSSRLRMAAIRGLGAIGTPGAADALREASEGHPDPATRRRAGAELAKRPEIRPGASGRAGTRSPEPDADGS